MAKTKNNREGGIGGSLKNSLSKLTERVTLKAPPTKDMPKATASKPVQPATPTPMSPPAKQTPNGAESVQSRPNNGSLINGNQKGNSNGNLNGSKPQQNTSSSAPKAEAKPEPKPQNTTPIHKPAPQSTPTPAANTTPPPAITSASNTLGNDVSIDGKLQFADNLIFDGRLKGQIVSDGALAIHPNAVIEATVSVKTLVIAGKVVGDITATESVHLAASAVVIGDITTGSLTMEPQASFQGRGNIGKPTSVPAQAAPAKNGSNTNGAPQNTMKVAPAPSPVAA